MPILDKLERGFGRFAIPGVTLYIVIGQVIAKLAEIFNLPVWGLLEFEPRLVIDGQWWRVISFVFLPPSSGMGVIGLTFLVLTWWFFYFMGNALESYWGAFRYNVFLLVGYIFTVGLAFFEPDMMVSNLFFLGSVFLAFAYLNPNFEVLLLILPVKIKWLALVTWLCFAWQFLAGGWSDRLQVIAATGNVLLFFGLDAWKTAGLRMRRTGRDTLLPGRPVAAGQARHRCRICGKTDVTNPEMDFRYCSKCAGEQCYCPEHIFNHVHVQAEDEAPRGR